MTAKTKMLRTISQFEVLGLRLFRKQRMIKDSILYTIRGVGLSIFGMKPVPGVPRAGHRLMNSVFESTTKEAVAAFRVGAGIGLLVQFNLAIAIMAIGFVNAGLLSLKQAICVIMGANDGTAVRLLSVSGRSVSALETKEGYRVRRQRRRHKPVERQWI